MTDTAPPITPENATRWSRPRIAAAAAVALLLAGLLVAADNGAAFRRQSLQEAKAQAEILAASVTAALAFNDDKAADEYLSALRTNPEIQAAGVYGVSGAQVAAYRRTPGQPLPDKGRLEGVPGADKALEVSVPVVQAGTTLGSVYLRTDAEPLSRRVLRYGTIGLLGIMASLVVAVMASAQSALDRTNRALVQANAALRQQIAERERVEEALRQSQKMEAVGQLTGGIAHDFNNMLAVVIGSLDLLRLRVGDRDAGVLRYLDAAADGAKRGAVLTQRLLAFSRQQPLRPQTIDLNKLVAGMSDLLRHSLGAEVRLETVLAGGLWRARVDPNQLENVILNLAVNARDAMPEGGRLTIETQNAHLDARYAAIHPGVPEGQYVMVAVTDTGSGMPPEVIAKAFEPFFTTKDVGKGTGLGLSQVYGFVRQSGGHVKIYSEPGQGTTVKVYLPRPLTADIPGPEAPAARLPAPSGQQEVVLVVEDESAVRQFSVDALRVLGYRVLEADGAVAALRLLADNPDIALMFTDVIMPDVNGRKLADEARRARPDLKVLFTTGYTRNAVVHNGVLDADVDMIGKPFTIEALAAKLREVLDAG
jgi:signal transduction histidine kinase